MKHFLTVFLAMSSLIGCIDEKKPANCPSTELCAERRDTCFNRCDTLHRQDNNTIECANCCNRTFNTCDNCGNYNYLDCK